MPSAPQVFPISIRTVTKMWKKMWSKETARRGRRKMGGGSVLDCVRCWIGVGGHVGEEKRRPKYSFVSSPRALGWRKGSNQFLVLPTTSYLATPFIPTEKKRRVLRNRISCECKIPSEVRLFVLPVFVMRKGISYECIIASELPSWGNVELV